MNELALFAGAGGGILGGKLLGWRTICAVEINDYCRRVLMQRQDDGILEPFPIWDDIRTFDGRPWRGVVDVVSGGFPCQDISAAGKGAGIEGERSGLWREMARVIREVRPRFVFVENSPLLVRRGLAVVLGDLAEMGFDARWGVLGAIDAGAPHKRDRIWIVANASSKRARNQDREIGCNTRRDARWNESAFRQADREDGADRIGTAGQVEADVADTSRIQQGREVERSEWERNRQSSESGGTISDADSNRCYQVEQQDCEGKEGAGQFNSALQRSGEWWHTEPDVGRVVDELANRLDGPK